MKTKLFRVQRFRDQNGVLLCRPYAVNLNSPLVTRSRHLHPEEQCTQRLDENIDILLWRRHVVDLNSLLATNSTSGENVARVCILEKTSHSGGATRFTTQAGLPGRIPPVNESGTDLKPAGFFGPGTRASGYPV